MNIDIRQCGNFNDVNRELRKIKEVFTNLNVFFGFGSPENIISAKLGSMYLNLNGGSGVTLWVKESNDKGSSGWIAK